MTDDPIKKLRYFTGQYLEADDFTAEQKYHVDLRRRGNRVLYSSAGILDGGFQVKIKPGSPGTIVISPGIGICTGLGPEADPNGPGGLGLKAHEGCELILVKEKEASLPVGSAGEKYVWLRYLEIELDQQVDDRDVSDTTRIEETVDVQIRDNPPNVDEQQFNILIAKVSVDSAGNGVVDLDLNLPNKNRQIAMARLPGDLTIGQGGNGTLHTRHVDGKDWRNDNDDDLLLNYSNGKNIVLGFGDATKKSSLYVSGNIGIGAQSANSALEIRGPNSPIGPAGQREISLSFEAAGSARIRAFRGAGWDTFLEFLTTSATIGSDRPEVRLHIHQSGNVGIGTGSAIPDARLEVLADTSEVVGILGRGGPSGPGGVFVGGSGRTPAISLFSSGGAEAVRIGNNLASPARYSTARPMEMFIPGIDWHWRVLDVGPSAGTAEISGPLSGGARFNLVANVRVKLWRVFRLPLNALITSVQSVFNHGGTDNGSIGGNLAIQRYSLNPIAVNTVWDPTSVLDIVQGQFGVQIPYDPGPNTKQFNNIPLNQDVNARTVANLTQWFGCELLLAGSAGSANNFEGLVIGYNMLDTLYIL